MEMMEYLRSKVGENIRIPATYTMTGRGKDIILQHLANLVDSKEIDFKYSMSTFAGLVRESFYATGDELSTRRGKWSTRFRKELKSRHIILSDEQNGRIGDTVMRYTDQDGPWFVDITDKLDWSPGDFRDSDSCFWTSRSNNRDMIEFYKGLAMRTYSSDSYSCGSGRTWIAKPFFSPEVDYTVMFNAYGKPLDKFAHIVKRMCEMEGHTPYTSEVEIYNNDGDFWVNKGQGIALSFKMYTGSYISTLNYLNINGRYTYISNYGHLPICHVCKNEVVPTMQNRYIQNLCLSTPNSGNANLICPNCINSMNGIFYCDYCQRYHPNDNRLIDKNGHTTCVFAMMWMAACSGCGQISTFFQDVFRPGENGEMIFNLDTLHESCRQCLSTHSEFNVLFGPVCRECYYKMRDRGSFDYNDNRMRELLRNNAGLLDERSSNNV